MTRIYEALVLAQQEGLMDTSTKALVKTNKELNPSVYEKLLFMHEGIIEKKTANKYLHFIGLSDNKDDRALIHLYARMLSEQLKKKVAVCMGSIKNSKGKMPIHPNEISGSQGFIHEMESEFIDRLLHNERGNNGIDEKCEELEYYDWVLLYSSSQNGSLLPLLLTKAVSDTVLILNSETVKYDEVEAYVKKIRQAGGNLLGVVMNKKIPYIPKYIEKYL